MTDMPENVNLVDKRLDIHPIAFKLKLQISIICKGVQDKSSLHKHFFQLKMSVYKQNMFFTCVRELKVVMEVK